MRTTPAIRLRRRPAVGVLVATVVAAVVLTGCGGAADAPAEPTGVSAADATGGTIRFQTYQSPDVVKVWDEQWKGLQSSSNITVETESVPQDDQSQRLLTQAASKQLPDVAMISARWFAALASRGLLEPINAESIPALKLDDFHPALREAYSYEGQLYGVPTDLDVGLLFYNKELFAAAGEPEPTPDWTWDQFRSASQRLTTGSGAERQWGADIEGGGTYPMLTAVAASYGGGLITDGQASLESGGGRKALELYDQMLRVDKSVPSPGTENAQIGNGQIAMGIYGPWAAFYYLNEAEFDWGVTSLPKGDSEATFGWGSVMVVFKDSDKKAEALKFMENFLSTDLQTQRATDWAWTPPTASLLTDSTFGSSGALALDAEQKALVARAVGVARPPVIVSEQLKLENALEGALSGMATGDSDAARAAADLTAAWGPLLK